jgi:hypothetical protein
LPSAQLWLIVASLDTNSPVLIVIVRSPLTPAEPEGRKTVDLSVKYKNVTAMLNDSRIRNSNLIRAAFKATENKATELTQLTSVGGPWESSRMRAIGAPTGVTRITAVAHTP